MDGTSEIAKVSLAIKGVQGSNKASFKPVYKTETQENTPKPTHTGSNPFSLPPEVLFSIFPLAIPPYALLDTTLYAGKNSTWNQALRLMKSIVLVCRGWYDVGIIFLYENISIRRGQELESLRQTLTSLAAKNLGLLVKSLAIQCYIPEDNFDFGADLETVVGCCTSLSTFSYNTPFVPPAQAIPIVFPLHITHFRLEGYFDYDLILPILKQLEETLLSLYLGPILGNDLEQTSKNWRKLQSQFLCLSSLQSLSVAVPPDFTMLGECWTMASLQRLTLLDLFHGHSGYSNMQSTVVSFLSVHGHKIRQLQIAVYGFAFEAENFKSVLKFCPQLERIIMPSSAFPYYFWINSDYFFHPHLRFIDLTNEPYSPSELCLSKKALPSLELIRRFCNLPHQLYKWLNDYPPNPEAEMGKFVIDVFQHHLDCHKGLYIWMLEQDVLKDRVSKGEIFSGSFTVWEDANSDSDGDYMSTSSDEEEGSSEEEEWTSDLMSDL